VRCQVLIVYTKHELASGNLTAFQNLATVTLAWRACLLMDCAAESANSLRRHNVLFTARSSLHAQATTTPTAPSLTTVLQLCSASASLPLQRPQTTLTSLLPSRISHLPRSLMPNATSSAPLQTMRATLSS